MGFRPPVGCTLLPVVQNLAAAGSVILVCGGVVLAGVLANKRPGVTLIFGGLFVGILPLLTNGYLVRLGGIGCLP